MKAYEFPATVSAEGSLELPSTVAKLLPANQMVRVIVLVPEAEPYDTDLTPDEENSAWRQFAAEQLLKQYSEEDEIYDQL